VPLDHRQLPTFAADAVEVPFVIAGFDELVDTDTCWSEHSHPTHELLWNERGASSVTVGPRTWTITPLLGLWVPAGVVHTGLAPAGTWYRTSHFGVRTVASISDGPVAVTITPLLRLLLQRLGEEGLSDGSRGVTEAMVLDVLRPADRELIVHVPSAQLLRPIVDAVRADPGDPRTLEVWARELGVSTRTLSRAFRAETGQGYSAWLSAVRTHRAIALLARGEDLADVADELGYASVSAFGAAFRRVTGATPTSFRPRPAGAGAARVGPGAGAPVGPGAG